MSIRLGVWLALIFMMGCRSTDIHKREHQPLDSELNAEPAEEVPERDEGVPAFLVDPTKVSFEFQPPQPNEVGRALKLKIAADAFAEVPYGETIGLALYRLNDMTREAVYESDGLRRVRAKKIAAMDVLYEEGRTYEFPIVDMTGAFQAPLVLKIVPLLASPESDGSVFLPKAEKTIRGVYVLSDQASATKVFDVQTLRLDAPTMLGTE